MQNCVLVYSIVQYTAGAIALTSVISLYIYTLFDRNHKQGTATTPDKSDKIKAPQNC